MRRPSKKRLSGDDSVSSESEEISCVGKDIVTDKKNDCEMRRSSVFIPPMRRFSEMLLLLILLVLAIQLFYLSIVQRNVLSKLDDEKWKKSLSAESEFTKASLIDYAKRPIVWIQAKNPFGGYLKHVLRVFERFGYRIVTEPGNGEWNVLWTHDYPFGTSKTGEHLRSLRSDQKINKFPGSGYVTSKVELANSDGFSKYVPKAFKIPGDKEVFDEYVKEHPDSIWVQKGNNHRGVEILPVDKLNFSKPNTFIQRYVDKPFLIDGYKFDLGIYTIITSVSPLRLYVYWGDMLIRLCPEKYYPFDTTNVNQYVVGDNYKAVWDTESLKKYYNKGPHTFKDTFTQYLVEQGKDADALYESIFDAIRMAYLSKESVIANAVAHWSKPELGNFFELVRFDFVLDEDLNVYLMEANMSPNLSSAHFSQNRELYERVLFNALSLAGLAVHVNGNYGGKRFFGEEAEMIVSDRSISTFPDLCLNGACANVTCETAGEKCAVCPKCWTQEQKLSVKQAFIENSNIQFCKRIFPKEVSYENAVSNEVLNLYYEQNTLNEKNRWMSEWYRGMCLINKSWCSVE